jgi:hypothetical protein
MEPTGTDPTPPGRALPPAREVKRRPLRGWRLVVLLVALGLFLVGGGFEAFLYWVVPPHNWKGWVDNDRRTLPEWTPPPAPQDNAADYYAAAGAALPSESERAPLEEWCWGAARSAPAETTTSGIAGIVEKSRPALAKLHGGIGKPYSGGGRPGDLGLGQALPRLARFRALSRTAAAVARYDHVEGRDEQALHAIADAEALGVSLVSGEGSIQALVGYACVAIAQSPAESVVRDGCVPEEALRARVRTVRGLRDGLPGYGAILRWEAAEKLSFLDLVVAERMSAWTELAGDGDWPAYYCLGKLKAEDSRVWMNDRMARLIDAADGTSDPSRFAALCRDASRAADERAEWPMLSDFDLWRKGEAQYRRLVAQLEGQELIAALELHKRAHGAYPAALNELVPEYLPEVPADPFTGGPMLYRRIPEGYVLYSANVNGVDDGGVRGTVRDPERLGDPDGDLILVDDRPETPAGSLDG